MISVVLIEPEISGNIGAVARVMANFDFKELIIINPKCEVLCEESICRAKHAQDILNNAKVLDFSCLKKFDYLVATTSKLGNDFNLPRSPISPENFAKSIKNKQKAKIAVLFGREGSGLSNNEIQNCDFTVAIPTSRKYSAMNISHSVAIVLYEICKAMKNSHIADHIRPITLAEKNQIMKMLDQILKKLPFSTEEKAATQRKVWKRIFGRSFLSKREAYAVMGFFRKILK